VTNRLYFAMSGQCKFEQQ